MQIRVRVRDAGQKFVAGVQKYTILKYFIFVYFKSRREKSLNLRLKK